MNKEIILKKCEFYVEGMHCAACELLIEDELSQVKGIQNIKANLSEGKVYMDAEREVKAEELRG